MAVPHALRPIIGKPELLRAPHTTDFTLAKRRVTLESLKAQSILDAARRRLAIQTSKTTPDEISEGKCWNIAVRWLIDASKERPDPFQTPEELVNEALFAIADLSADGGDLVADEAMREGLKKAGFTRVSIASLTIMRQYFVEAIIEHNKRLNARFSDRPIALNPRFANADATNNFALPALVIVELYKCHWQDGHSFKWLKGLLRIQHLRIKAFSGANENAVKTQIWIAIRALALRVKLRDIP